MFDRMRNIMDGLQTKKQMDFGIDADSAKVLVSTEIHFDKDVVAQKQEEVLQVMQKIGLERMTELFTQAVSELCLKLGNFKNNQRLVKAFFRNAHFVREQDPSFEESFTDAVLKQFKETIEAVAFDATTEELAQFKMYIARLAIAEISDDRNSHFQKGKVIDTVASYFPDLLARRAAKLGL